jgi:hypothetical protein
MTFFEQIKDLFPRRSHRRTPPVRSVAKIAETDKVEEELAEAIKAQESATSRMSKQSFAVERSSRVASTVTKTLIRRRLALNDILQSAEQATHLLEGIRHAPPRD